MTNTRTAVALVGAVALVASACGGSGSGAAAGGDPVDGRTFSFGIGSDPGNLDPHLTVLSVTNQVDRFLYDTLLGLADDGKPVRGLAEKWEASTTTATFTLREGITCADGAPLTATDVAENINFVGNPANRSTLVGLLVQAGTTAKADEATRAVTVTSGAPDAFLLRNIGSMAIVCGSGLKDRALIAKGGAGTGMFTLTESVSNDHYTLERRKDYKWAPGEVKSDERGLPDKVVLRVVPNSTTAANLLLSGELNAATVTGPDRQRLEAKQLFHADFRAAMGEMFFNQAEGRVGKDESTRRALVQALDLDRIGKVLTAGNGKPSTGLVTTEPMACSGDTVAGNTPKFDTAAAKSTLDGLGWKPGADGIRVKDGKRLTLSTVYASYVSSTMPATAELFQQQWKEIGAEVTLNGVDSTGINQVLFVTGDWDVSLTPIGLTLPSQAVPFVSGPAAPNGQNFPSVANPAYEKTAKEAAALAGEASCATWAAAEKELFKRVDVVPYIDSTVPVFGSAAKFSLSQASITPSSIRMYAK
ncbi:ABC transporter substrate-binding protein [Actinosynnema sp. NPDC020468]|uniref:ABC transporter substrate-binding protein n=1 Tax=Actinosynnema sp. NPDC020468 TaxID=3154488 RepID=UPI0033D4A9FD